MVSGLRIVLKSHTDHLFTPPALQSALQQTTASRDLESNAVSPASAGISQPIPATHSAFLSNVNVNSGCGSCEPEVYIDGELLINPPHDTGQMIGD
jgi:hypothetical protein